MIEIHLGVTARQAKPPDAIELRNPNEYPHVRLTIQRAQETSEPLAIWVTTRVCDNWFWDLENVPNVQLIDSSATKQLQAKLRVAALPTELVMHPDLILDWGLLEINEPIRQSEDIWSWIARTRLGEIWAEQIPTKQHFVQLTIWLAENEIPHTYWQFAQQRIEQWSHQAGRLEKVYLDLLEDPTNRAISLICYIVLGIYQEDVRLKWLRKCRWFSTVLIDHIGSMALRYDHIPSHAQSEISKFAREYWDKRLANPGLWQSEDKAPKVARQALLYEIQKCLDEMSGCLGGELEALLRSLDNVLMSLPTEVPLLLSEKFTSISEAPSMIQHLASRLPPPFPDAPLDDWMETDWTEWAAHRYIPYRRWCILQGNESIVLDSYASAFEAWLYDNYPKLLMQTDTTIVSSTPKIVSGFLDDDCLVLWAFVDNLSNLWRSEFENALEQAGLRIESISSFIAMLPTITEVSKPASLLGLTPKQYALDKQGSLAEQFQRIWSNKGYQTAVISDSGERLLAEAARGPQLLLFQYTRLDKLLHDNLQDLEEKRSEVSSYLFRLCQLLHEGLTALSKFGEAKIVISTDHGCTKIPTHIPPLQIPPFAEMDAEMKTHRRYVRIKSLEHINRTQWFTLDRDQFELPFHYAIPKGRVSVDGHPLGLTHGGLTPEEVVIPGLVCQLASPVERINLRVEHVSPSIRLMERAQVFELEIYNPIEMAIKSLQIHIPRYFGDFEPISKLEARSSVRVQGTIKLPSSPTSSESVIQMNVFLEGLLENGRNLREEVSLEVPIHKLYESEIDDMFGEV